MQRPWGRNNKGATPREGAREQHAWDKFEQSAEDSARRGCRLGAEFVMCTGKPHGACPSDTRQQMLDWG